MMAAAQLEVVEQAVTLENLQGYGDVSIAFRVESFLRIEPIERGLDGFNFSEEPAEPYIKDYDAHVGPDDGSPARWLRWASPRSCLLVALEGGQRVGGAVVFSHVEGMGFLRGRPDTAALWDIRVAPERRGRGIGTALFRAAVGWSRARGFQRLKIETQNINVAACRFYAGQGCYLGGIERHAYRDYPEEIELIWYREL